MRYIIADPDIQNGIELKRILDGYEILDFQGSYVTLCVDENYILRDPPDIAFIWLGNAELNAFKLASVIRKRNPLSKVIFMSSQRESAVEAFEYGADGFLLIPFNKKTVSKLLQQNTVIEEMK